MARVACSNRADNRSVSLSSVSGWTKINAWRQCASIADSATSSTRSDGRNCGFLTRRACRRQCRAASKEQVKLAKEMWSGLPVEFRLDDYRNVSGSYDAVVSIGMAEHIGYKNHRTMMEVIHRSLKMASFTTSF